MTRISLTYKSIHAPVPRSAEPVCAVIGNFDGVHIGHQSLFTHAITLGLRVVAVTFNPHPRAVLGTNPPAQLLSAEDRSDLLEAVGADDVITIEFSKEFASISPETFVRNVLVERLNTRALVHGYDFSLGKSRTGNADKLRQLGERFGFSVFQLPASPDINGNPISSTSIREALLNGQVSTANAMLGRAHIVRGAVVHGQHRGHDIGFPTANLDPYLTGMATCRLARPGVYATRILIPAGTNLPPASKTTRNIGIQPDGSHVYASVTNIGHNPTFGNNELTVETHIPNFNGNLYGVPVELSFLERLRDECRFANINELKKQLAIDTQLALTYSL